MKIILLQNLVPNYRESLLKEICKLSEKDSNTFEIWASTPPKEFEKRNTVGNKNLFRRVEITRIPFFDLYWQHLPLFDIVNADVVVVSDNFRTISNIFVLLIRRFFKKPVGTWGHGVNYQPSTASKFLRPFRLGILNISNKVLVYTKKSYIDLLSSGFDEKKINISDNTLDYSASLDLHSEHPEVLAFKTQYSLHENPCVVFLGSFHNKKNPQSVIEYGNMLYQKDPKIKVLVIGGGDTKCFNTNYPWLIYLGPLFGREKYIALHSAKCMIVLEMAGLNIVDAIFAKLPIIVKDSHNHSPEIFYLKNKINGYLAHDVKEVIKHTIYLCHDHSNKIKDNHINEILRSTLTINNVAKNIYEFFLLLSCDSKEKANKFRKTAARR